MVGCLVHSSRPFVRRCLSGRASPGLDHVLQDLLVERRVDKLVVIYQVAQSDPDVLQLFADGDQTSGNGRRASVRTRLQEAQEVGLDPRICAERSVTKTD